MIRSMTAFGREVAAEKWGQLSCEIRSVNHRYLDANIRLPEELRNLEQKIRETIGKHIKRGKVDCNIRLDTSTAEVNSVKVNDNFAHKLIDACKDINRISGNKSPIDPIQVLKWPGVIAQEEVNIEPIAEATVELLEKTLNEMVATREREGEKIVGIITDRCTKISENVVIVKEKMPLILQKIRDKVLTRINELELDIDCDNNHRLEQELVMQAQKLDVDEELDRLETHLVEVKRILSTNEPSGRRLDFLMQELNREANTLGSKSADAETTKCAVNIKVLIEQMREQIQNIE